VPGSGAQARDAQARSRCVDNVAVSREGVWDLSLCGYPRARGGLLANACGGSALFGSPLRFLRSPHQSVAELPGIVAIDIL